MQRPIADRLKREANLFEHEFAQERASALGRLGRALEAALSALAALDGREGAGTRAALRAEASLALWQFVVQREACGLRDLRQVIRDYRVPPEVAARMGVLPAAPAAARRGKPGIGGKNG